MNERQAQRLTEWLWEVLPADPEHDDRRMLGGGMHTKTKLGLFAVITRIVKDED